jgi:hypothetical protein
MGKANLPELHKRLWSVDAAVYGPARQQLGELSADNQLALLRIEMKRGRGERAGSKSWVTVLADFITRVVGLLVFRPTMKRFGSDDVDSRATSIEEPPESEPESTQLANIADALARSQDPAAAAGILEAVLMSPNLYGRLSLILEDRLLAVVPDHKRYWHEEQHVKLLRWIVEENDKGYIRHVLAGIHAVEQIGTEEAITPIFRLTFHPSGEVCAAAERCREVLQRRARANRVGKDLLRAGVRPAARSVDLLRPASSTPSSDPSELLRADDADGVRVE